MARGSERIDPATWGVDVRYEDVAKVWHRAPAPTIERILATMGARRGGPDHGAAPSVATQDDLPVPVGPWQLVLEDGSHWEGRGPLPHDLPLGYHRLSQDGAQERSLVVAPAACPSVADLRTSGWALQLYALRSTRSWGIGDFGDLRRFGDLARSVGTPLVLVNPLHAPKPSFPQQPSPYFPSSREFRNPLYIAIEDVPGAELVADLDRLVVAGRALNAGARIDRDAVWAAKLRALEAIWAAAGPPSELDRYAGSMGDALDQYATYCLLVERHGADWHRWPEDLRHPGSEAVARARADEPDRVAFHKWLQWLLDCQLAAASDGVELVQDLAVGVDVSGADAWLAQDALALDMRVGAPPDEFNTQGQEWGLPPFDPWRLRALDYAPFVRMVRAGLRHAAGLRIDHVMGLFRLFWIPAGASPREGTYVRYPWRDLLRLVALESHRAGAHIVGEDLGTVEPEVRDHLRDANVMSYRLLWFEQDRPAAYPQRSFAAVTTHDLPTIAGLWSGKDLELQRDLGTQPNEASTEEIRVRLARWTGLDVSAPVEDVVTATHRLLAKAPSAMVAATVEDALCVAERPNYPGTVDEYPNWSVPLPVALDDLAGAPGFVATAAVLRERSAPQPSRDEAS